MEPVPPVEAHEPPDDKQFDLSIHLDKEEMEKLERHLTTEIDRYMQDTQHRRGSVERWRQDFELMPTGRSTRWKGSADVSSPLTHIYCQSHHTRLNQQIVQAMPPVAVVARKQEALDAAPAIEEAMTSILEEANWQQIADDVHLELPVTGNCLVRVTYDVQYRRSPRFHFDFDEEGFSNRASAGEDPESAFIGSLATDSSGEPAIGLHWENVLTHAGVSFKVVPWEDCIMLPASARDPEELRGIGERLMIRGSELKQGAKAGKYISDAVDQLLTHPGDAEPAGRSGRLTQQGIAAQPGQAWAGAQQDPLYRDYACHELCWQMDANNDGEEEWVIVTRHEKTKRIVRLQYLPYEHGQPYYVPFRYFIRPRELLGMGIAEKIASIQDAHTAVLNQILDHADLVLNARANFFYDQTSGFHPDKFVLKLGTPIPVDNVDGLKPFPIQEIPAEHYQVHQLLRDLADLITATSNPALGKSTDADKTLGEVQIVASASNMIFEEVAGRVSRSWAKVWDQVRWLYGQYGENGQVQYRVSATPGHMIEVENGGQPTPAAQVGGRTVPAPGGVAFGTIPASILLADVDLVPSGLQQLSDMQSRLQQMSIIQNTCLMHPLTAQNMPALKIVLDEFFQAARFRQREKVMAEVEQQLQAQMFAEQMGLANDMAGQAMGQPPVGPAGPGAGGETKTAQGAVPAPPKTGAPPAQGAPPAKAGPQGFGGGKVQKGGPGV